MQQTCPACKNEMVWVDYGPKMQYHYCRSCKKELAELQHGIAAMTVHIDTVGKRITSGPNLQELPKEYRAKFVEDTKMIDKIAEDQKVVDKAWKEYNAQVTKAARFAEAYSVGPEKLKRLLSTGRQFGKTEHMREYLSQHCSDWKSGFGVVTKDGAKFIDTETTDYSKAEVRHFQDEVSINLPDNIDASKIVEKIKDAMVDKQLKRQELLMLGGTIAEMFETFGTNIRLEMITDETFSQDALEYQKGRTYEVIRKLEDEEKRDYYRLAVITRDSSGREMIQTKFSSEPNKYRYVHVNMFDDEADDNE